MKTWIVIVTVRVCMCVQRQFFKDLGKAMQRAVGEPASLPAPPNTAAPAIADKAAKAKKR